MCLIDAGNEADDPDDDSKLSKPSKPKTEQTLFDIVDYMQDFDHDIVPVYPVENDYYAPTTPADTPRGVDIEDLINEENQLDGPPESVDEPLEELVPGVLGRRTLYPIGNMDSWLNSVVLLTVLSKG